MNFYIKQKISLKDKFNIFDEKQNLIYQINGKFMSLKNKLEMIDVDGKPILNAQKKVFSFLPKYFIYDGKEEVASVKRIFGFRPRFHIEVQNKEMYVEGNLFAHAFEITDHGQPVATIKKKLISWGDTYEIEILSEENVELFLFVVIVIDQVIEAARRRN